MAKWFNNEEEKVDPGKAVEAKFESFESAIKEQKEVSTQTQNTMAELAKTIKELNEREAAREAARVKAENAAKPKPVSLSTEEEAEALLTDPSGYIDRRLSGTARLALMSLAMQKREQVLGKKEYYYGDFKAKVDALIENTTNLEQTTNVGYIENCYKVVLADHLKEIMAGELKAQTSMYSDNGSSSGNSTRDDGKITVKYRDSKTERAAALLGVTDEDVIKYAKEEAIHGLEVVA